MVAIKKGYLTIVELLLENGASLIGREIREVNDIPLVKAVDSRNKEIVNALLERGALHAIITERNAMFQIPDHLLAIDNEDLPMIKFLEEKGVLNLSFLCNGIKDDEGEVVNSALMRAAAVGNSDIFNYLLDYGADVSVVACNGYTALTHALKSGVKNEYIVMQLLEKGVDVNAIPHSEGGAGHPVAIAVEKGWSEIVVAALLEYGSDVEAGGLYYWFFKKGELDKKKDISRYANAPDYCTSPLRIAAYNGDVIIAEVLLKYGATVDVPITDKSHPINIAAGRGGKVVELFLDCDRLKINLDEIGDRLMKIGKTYGHLGVIDVLRARGVK